MRLYAEYPVSSTIHDFIFLSNNISIITKCVVEKIVVVCTSVHLFVPLKSIVNHPD